MITIFWAGTTASIPSGWQLNDGSAGTPDLRNKYIKTVGSAENPGATGGGSTHTHTSSAHNHTQDAHSHTGGMGNATEAGPPSRGTHGTDVARNTHSHTFALASTTATNQTTTVTIDSTSNDPPYYKVAFISPTTGIKFPSNTIIWWNSATPPTNWAVCDGTPDLRNVYLKCIGAGEDAGGTGGSSNSHTHSNTAHNHTQDSHSHVTSHSVPSDGWTRSTQTETSFSPYTHSHQTTSTAVTSTNQTSSVSISSDSGEPLYYKLLLIKNTGVANRPKNGIVGWSGTLATIPNGYVLCDGGSSTPNLLSYFIKGATSSGELGNTGGSATHTHTPSSHNHTQDSHSHNVSNGGTTGNVNADHDQQGFKASKYDHTHSVGSPVSDTATNQATTVSVSTDNSEPAYYKLAYIMQTRELDVGAYAFSC